MKEWEEFNDVISDFLERKREMNEKYKMLLSAVMKKFLLHIGSLI